MGEKKTPARQAVGRRLAEARDRHRPRLSQGDIALELGKSERTVSRWERGASLPKAKSELRAIEKAYGLAPASLDGPTTHSVVSRGTGAGLDTVSPRDFGVNVHEHRLKRGMAPAELARAVGLHEAESIEQLEAGRSMRKLRAELLPKLAKALRVKPALLLRERPSAPYQPAVTDTATADLLWEIARDMKRLTERIESHGLDILRSAVPQEPSQ